MTGLKVYIVDDDASVRKALRRLLDSAGFRVETFTSAEDFLSLPNMDPEACLILDLHLPGKGGFDLLQHLADTGESIPTVLITAHDDRSIRDRIEKCGVGFLRKPFTDTELLHAMKEAEETSRENLSESMKFD